ncbi:MAG: hypothetical protein A3K10_16100 [Bacteroidetes bacterium RIFCSPLOWO2_12_FULL_31_6]|nr:MAG: hypothetical protein A3K10_16100 [Bacteroidetes bacterium RIFCSPLOWO2_12_FULL_31_6]
MNKFDDIIKQKVEQFEVPYNEAHWAEMEGKLNTIRSTKITKNIFSAIGAMAILSIASYFIYTNISTTHINTETVTNNNKVNEVLVENNNDFNTNNINKAKKNVVTPVLVDEITNKVIEPKIVQEEKIIENNNNVEEKTNPTIVESDGNNVMLNAEFIVFNNKVCLGEKVSFEAISKNLPVSYSWDFGDGTTSNKANPTHIYNECGNYDVTLTLINRKTGDEIKNTEKNSVAILPQPNVEFSYAETSVSHDDNKLKYPYTEFSSKANENISSYTWNFGNGEKSSSQNPKIIYSKKGDFQVVLNVKNIYGCSNAISKNVTITQDFSVLAPNSFSPDGDGLNETFIPKALLGWEVQFEMTIIDKASKLIYKTTDKNEPWNGKLNNTGSLLEVDLYFWQVITYDAEGIPHRFHGHFNLMK